MGFFDGIIGLGRAVVNPFIDAGKAIVNTIGSGTRDLGKGLLNLSTGNWRGALDSGAQFFNTIGSGATRFSDAVHIVPFVGDIVGVITDPVTYTIRRGAGEGKI